MSNDERTGCTRRQWCAVAGGTLLLAGCEATMPLDDGGSSGGDQGSSAADMAKSSSSCAGSIQAGPASAITASAPKQVSGVLVCRDANGLYAMSAICPHAGCTVRHQSSGFFCPCHGATFDANGQNPTSPARSPLAHYALCVDSSGNVVVDDNTTVSPSTRTS
jgi:Rieske Fe-S protein